MSLSEQINQGIKAAMLAKEEARLRSMRAIKAALLLAQAEKGPSSPLDEETELKVLQKMAKQRRDSIEIFAKEGRDDLLKKEQEELAVIEEFLPQPLSEAELTAGLKEIIAQSGASGPGDLGKVMPLAMKAFSGKADGKLINSLIRQLLA